MKATDAGSAPQPSVPSACRAAAPPCPVPLLASSAPPGSSVRQGTAIDRPRNLSATMGRHFLQMAGAFLLIAACSPASQPDPEGEPSTPEDLLTWMVSDTASLSIGDEPSEASSDLYRVRGVVELSDGRIVVADAAQRLLFFDEAGQHLQSVGQRGEGPGEFRALTWIARLPNDTILAWDLQNARRLSYFSADGGFVRSVTPPPIARVLGALADGSLVGMRESGYLSPFQSTDPAAVDWARPEVELVRFDAEGQVLNSLGTFAGTEEISLPVPGVGRVPASLGGERSPLLATLVVPAGDRVFVSTGERFEVQAVSREGIRLEPAIHQERDQTPLTEGSLSDFVRDSFSGYAIRDQIEWDALRWNVPEGRLVAAITELRLDEAGNLWIGELSSPEDEFRTWHVYDRSGAYLAVAMSPSDFEPVAIGTETVLGVWQDDLGVEHVQARLISRD